MKLLFLIPLQRYYSKLTKVVRSRKKYRKTANISTVKRKKYRLSVQFSAAKLQKNEHTQESEQLFVYGLHWDAIISRWAREHASRACERGRCPRRYKKYTIYANFSDMKIFLYTCI